MRLTPVGQKANMELGQLCARSARAIVSYTPTVGTQEAASLMELGMQLAEKGDNAEFLKIIPVRNPRSIWWEAHGNFEQGGEHVAVTYADGDMWILTEVQFDAYRAADGKQNVGQLGTWLALKSGLERNSVLAQVAEILGGPGSTLPLHGKQPE